MMHNPSSRNADAPQERIASRMRREGLPPLVIDTFLRYYGHLVEGHQGWIDRSTIEPVRELPDLEILDDCREEGISALQYTAIIKLNGGLGTGMGLNCAKSLLPAKEGRTFLDIIADQVLRLRERHGAPMPLILMNSFNTEEDTRSALARHPSIEAGQPDIPVTFLQHKVPKVRRDNLEPVEWPQDPGKEWCPPGHGEFYIALVTSGLLDILLEKDIRYVFVSNADNLGAVLDEQLLGYFALSGAPFMMEVADRTEADKKGGHLAHTRDGRLILRESAQCPHEEMDEFQDVYKYKYFNTNSLWIRLDALRDKLEENQYILELPLIVNQKTVDASDQESPGVYQLETAMGAAISVFPGAAALQVPRTRFAPVKTTNDLLALWSDNFVVNESMHVIANPARKRGPVIVHLDPDYYKLYNDFHDRFPRGAPSLLDCSRLEIHGDIRFGTDVKISGAVVLENPSAEQVNVPDGAVLTEGAVVLEGNGR